MSAHVSRRSLVILILGVVLAIVALFAIRESVGADSVGAALISNLPAVCFSLASATFMLWAALRFSAGEPIRRPWLALGLGMLATALGEVLWAFYEVVMRVDVPYPGIPDVFYLAAYPFFAAGLIIAIRSFRHVVPMTRSLVAAGVICGAASVWVYFAVGRTILADTALGAGTTFVSLFYPFGDVWFMLFPALVLALMLSSLAGGRVSWPWWAVVVGFGLIATADVLFTIQDWNGVYATGSPLDAGWWIGYALLAFAASLFVDIQQPQQVHAVASGPMRSQGVTSS